MTSKDENIGVGHCGRYCKDWICDEPLKWDDLCVGCPCNEEEEENEEDWGEDEV